MRKRRQSSLSQRAKAPGLGKIRAPAPPAPAHLARRSPLRAPWDRRTWIPPPAAPGRWQRRGTAKARTGSARRHTSDLRHKGSRRHPERPAGTIWPETALILGRAQDGRSPGGPAKLFVPSQVGFTQPKKPPADDPAKGEVYGPCHSALHCLKIPGEFWGTDPDPCLLHIWIALCPKMIPSPLDMTLSYTFGNHCQDFATSSSSPCCSP